MNEDKIIDQSQLAEDVASKIPFEMKRQFLVKPLDPIMVKKKFTKPVAKYNKPTEDENGIEAVDFDNVETEVKEVESDYRKGVVLKVPYEYASNLNREDNFEMPIKVGDIVVYKAYGDSSWFDLVKDTELVNAYNIIAIER